MDMQMVNDLNFLLRGELSAIEAYTEALKTVTDENALPVLEDCLGSHFKRSEKLRYAIEEEGGRPITSGGAWAGLAKLITGGAGAMGDKAMIAALEEGEDIGTNDYEWQLVKMHGKYRNLVKQELKPEQDYTHRKLIRLLAH